MSKKRFGYNIFCGIITDILENERNGINTRQVGSLFYKRTGKYYYVSVMRSKLHRMRKDGLIRATYSVEGYRWWNNKDDIVLKSNEVIVIKKQLWIVKDMNDKLLAVFTNKEDFEEFIDYSCMEFMEIII